MLTKPTGTPTPSLAICLLIFQKQQAIKAWKNKTAELSENTVWMQKTKLKKIMLLFLAPPPQPVSEEHRGEGGQTKFSVKKHWTSTSFVWRSVFSRRSGDLERHHKAKAWRLPMWQHPWALLCSEQFGQHGQFPENRLLPYTLRYIWNKVHFWHDIWWHSYGNE